MHRIGVRPPTPTPAATSPMRPASSMAASSTASPETSTYENRFQRVQQLTWQSPLTSRVFVEAGFGDYLTRWGGGELPGSVTRSLVRVTEQCALSCAANGNIPNLLYRSGNWASHWMGQHNWHASMSYVTGRTQHEVRLSGHVLRRRRDRTSRTTNEGSYRLNNGIPNLITLKRCIPTCASCARATTPFYAQEQWTVGPHDAAGRAALRPRVELLPGAAGRADALPAESRSSSRETAGVKGYDDISPRARLWPTTCSATARRR